MKQSLDVQLLIDGFLSRTGMLFEGMSGKDFEGHEYIELSPVGLHRSDTFITRITLGWRNLIVEFEPGAYASALLLQMGQATTQKKENFSYIVHRILLDGAIYEMEVNDSKVDPEIPSSWPDEWLKLKLRLLKSPLAVNTNDRKEDYAHIFRWGSKFLSSVAALLPIESEILLPSNEEGMPEGAKTVIEVNKYERNLQNRAECIAIHGARCSACEFDFGKNYGEIGEGFIEVHHILPVSELGHNYLVNPAKDLIPLCANCHAMIHRANPPLSIEELKEILISAE